MIYLLIVISLILSTIGIYGYIRDTLSGKTKPNKIVWFLWAFAPLLAATIALMEGVDVWGVIRTGSAGFFPLLVLLASFLNKKSYWKISTFDYVCCALALFALVLWSMADAPKTAILLLIVVEIFAAIPILLKMWNHPETETTSTYVLSWFATWITVPTVARFDIENAAFQIYLCTVTTLFLFILFRKNIFGSSRYQQ
jgi:hypothetical protein